MKWIRGHSNKVANVFTEYALVLGIASLVFMTMNTYIQRGFQGKVRDMSDAFIGQEHVGEIDPTAATTSSSDTSDNANLNTQMLAGGGTKLTLLDPASTNAQSRTEDTQKFADENPYIPAERGRIDTPQRSSDEDMKESDNWREIINREELERARDRRIAEAEMLETNAADIEAKGRELVRRARRMHCDDSRSCRRARRKMLIAGRDLITQANEMRQEANDLLSEAAEIQDRIDALTREIEGEEE